MISADSQQVLLDLNDVLNSLDISMMIVGAGARILIFDQIYGHEGRSTTDWDIAVSIASWKNFQDLSQALTQGSSPRFTSTRTLHRFIHLPTQIEVDVIPFGPIGEPSQQITWPDGAQMNLLGFNEALAQITTRTINELELPIVGLAGWLVLKMIAWSDRQQAKDLEDINFVLQHYEDERIFDALATELSNGNLEFEDAAIWLLGQDITQSFSPTTINSCTACLADILQRQNTLLPRLVDRNLDNPAWDNAFEQTVHRFSLLSKSLRSCPQPQR